MQVTESRVYPATPDAVWAIGGDVGNVADWIPALDRSRLAGDVRYATFSGGGGEATERIVARDDAARSYTYRYESGPLPLAFYESTFTVREHRDGAEVVWIAEFRAGSAEEERELAASIAGIYRGGLENLATTLS